jgi:hypothetical protein
MHEENGFMSGKLFCFLKRLFYTKKQLQKVNKDWTKLETMKKIKDSEENKLCLHCFSTFLHRFQISEENN